MNLASVLFSDRRLFFFRLLFPPAGEKNGKNVREESPFSDNPVECMTSHASSRSEPVCTGYCTECSHPKSTTVCRRCSDPCVSNFRVFIFRFRSLVINFCHSTDNMETQMENIPEHCPGIQSESAGKASTCAGCPNKKICESGEAKLEDPKIIAGIQQRMLNVKHKVFILSGKGGVGKSTITTMIARVFAQDQTKNIAVMDVDICGPSTPRIMGVEGETVHQSGSGWSPVYIGENLSLMSVGLLLGSPDDAVIWRGPKKNGLIKQFLTEVDWGSLDYLFVDTPPGTSDEHLSIAQYMIPCQLTGAIIVTSPQEISLLDVRKEINFCRKVNIPIIGIVENMSWFVCPKCTKESIIFPASTGGARQMAREFQLPFLGQIPLDHRLAQSCDEGNDFFETYSDSATATAFIELGKAIDAEIRKL